MCGSGGERLIEADALPRHVTKGGVSAIDAVEHATSDQYPIRALSSRWTSITIFGVALSFTVACLAFAGSASAAEGTLPVTGRAATGEPLFYPCSACHPVTQREIEQGRTLPNGFTRHQITLHGHASLGEGRAACAACHDTAAGDPGRLKLADGTLVAITGDVSRVCYRCHSAIYREFEAGIHGAGEQKCSSAGCHDPHTPGFIFAEGLLPFVGNGFQFSILSESTTFTPMAGPPVQAGHRDPEYLQVLAILGVALAAGLAIALVRGRSN